MTRFSLLAIILLLTGLFASGNALAGEGNDTNARSYAMRIGNDPDKPTFLTLCYHNVEDSDPDETYVGVTSTKLVEQFSWLQSNGYHPVSIDDILAARAGTRPLPSKAILLTFDDGYESAYTRVFPLLKAFHFPAVMAVVGAWLQPGDKDGMVEYGDGKLPRSDFLTWAQIREMSQSGLVEIASHSDEQHHGITANPQGNKEAAIVTLRYNADTNSYESEAAYEQRLDKDAAAMSDKIALETGKRPRVMIWPYGEYNDTAIEISTKNGMPITMSLEDAAATLDNLMAVPRHLVNADPDIDGFVIELNEFTKSNPVRVIQVDLDYVYDPDPAQQAKNLDALINRIFLEGINVVFLQAFADPQGDGLARQVYFPNRYLPMRADLFNRVSWQLQTRAQVEVFAWMPVLSYDFGDQSQHVMAFDPKTGKVAPDPKAYSRLSLFDPSARQKIIGLYEDLTRASPIQGILFHDDATLSDYEDASPAAMAAYAQAGFPDSISAIRSDPNTMKRWTQFKSNALTSFTKELLAHAQLYRSPLLSVRNIYAGPILDPESEEWFAQNMDDFLNNYDYVAVEAMPYMEGVDEDDADDWLRHLARVVEQKRPDALKRTIFELQSVDWRKKDGDNDRKIPTTTLARQMRLLARMGALNFGYYPDDFVQNNPDLSALHRDFSLQSYPYQP